MEHNVREICEIEEEDGILFDAQSVEGVRIQEDEEYDGVRVKLRAQLAGAKIPMQVDIGFGDAVYPEPSLAEFPVLLAMSAPVIRVYPREASIAEKLHAMVELDIRNSRMKDFYDIWFMANTWDFDQGTLRSAIAFSFARRGMAIPSGVPFALTEEFLSDPQKAKQWKAFLGRLDSIEQAALSLSEAFLLPCLLQKRIPPWLSGRRTQVGRPARRENDWLQQRCSGYKFGYTHQFALFKLGYAKLRRGKGLRLRQITVHYACLS